MLAVFFRSFTFAYFSLFVGLALAILLILLMELVLPALSVAFDSFLINR